MFGSIATTMKMAAVQALLAAQCEGVQVTLDSGGGGPADNPITATLIGLGLLAVVCAAGLGFALGKKGGVPNPLSGKGSIFTVVLLIVALCALGAGLAGRVGKGLAEDWSRGLPAVGSAAVQALPGNETMDPALFCRVTEQVAESAMWANHHHKVLSYFYVRYYSSLTMALICGILAAGSASLVMRKGWDDASAELVTTFFTLSTAALIFGVSTPLFRQEENIAENKRLYLGHLELQGGVRTVMATAASDTAFDASALVRRVQEDLDGLRDLAVSFDASAIPARESIVEQFGVGEGGG